MIRCCIRNFSISILRLPTGDSEEPNAKIKLSTKQVHFGNWYYYQLRIAPLAIPSGPPRSCSYSWATCIFHNWCWKMWFKTVPHSQHDYHRDSRERIVPQKADHEKNSQGIIQRAFAGNFSLIPDILNPFFNTRYLYLSQEFELLRWRIILLEATTRTCS